MRDIIKYVAAALAVIVFAIVFYFNTLKLSPAGYQLPRILIVIIILLSIAMLIEAFVQNMKMSKVKVEDKPVEEIEKISYIRAFVFAVLIAAYVFTIKPFGYFIVTPVYVIASYIYLKATGIRNIILISLGFTVFVYILFVVLLKLPIPLGPMT